MRFINLMTLALLLTLMSCAKEDPIKVLHISGNLADCEGVAQQKCLQVKYEGDTEWTLFYDTIKGFNHTKGMDYVIKVKETKVDNPPADGSSISYELVETIRSYKTPLQLGEGSWNVVSILDQSKFTRAPFITLTPSEKKIHGSTGCNKFFGSLVSDDFNFKVEEVGLTKMLCEDTETETKFLKMLEATTNFEIVDETLHLLSSDGKILIKAAHDKLRQ
ncbi:DUF4377 domain-containing protein [Winogradskyella sp. 3972H.M.0a.05]|uniref:DUF4377 domain-containing protein n=1 Tax=Winogradskyella sp. 3972H.M.0a.05 TaxID=2950277 RepID=UPI00339A324A